MTHIATPVSTKGKVLCYFWLFLKFSTVPIYVKEAGRVIKMNGDRDSGVGVEGGFVRLKALIEMDCAEARAGAGGGRLTTCVEALFLGKWCIRGEVK